MSARFSLRVETFSVFGLADDDDGEVLQRTIESALHKLAERLVGSPFERAGVRELALEQLSLGTLAVDELLSERGAERIADELYSALERRLQ
jgi:hypothetical protein